MRYNHSQFTLLPFFSFLAISAFVVFMSLEFGTVSWLNLLLLGIGVLVLIFSRLTVQLTATAVEASFGRGWPKKVIDLASVSSASTVRNQWWYGLGIRKIPNGWMYNVWGLDAVELILPDGKAFRIGTDEPDRLLAAIDLQRSVL